MRLLAGIILTLFASVWLALSLKQDPGYAMFSIGEWTVETSFAFLLLFLASLFVGCACEKVEAPSLCDRQLELCKLDLMVCRGGK